MSRLFNAVLEARDGRKLLLRNAAIIFLVFLPLVGLDRITKDLSYYYIDAMRPIEVTSFFDLVLVFNAGVSFGTFSNYASSNTILFFLNTGISAIVLVCGLRAKSLSDTFLYALVFGGAVGNLIDRILFGAVIDFLDFHFYGMHWPAFNVADFCVVVGALGLSFCLLKG